MPRVRDDQLRSRVARRRGRRGRRRSAAGRGRRGSGSARAARRRARRPARAARRSSMELLRARMQLDAARAEVEAALGLLDRALGQVEADERDRAVPPSAPRTRACGRSAARKAGCAVGLVQAEHEAVRRPRPRRLDALEAPRRRRSGRRCRGRGGRARRRSRRPRAAQVAKLVLVLASAAPAPARTPPPRVLSLCTRTVGSRAVPDVLIFCRHRTSRRRCAHEVPIAVPDPFLYAEKDGKQITVADRVRGRAHQGRGNRGARARRVRLRRLLAPGVPPFGREVSPAPT